MTFTTAVVAAALAALPAVSAHGYVQNAIVGGKTIFVGDPQWLYRTLNQPGWPAMNQDNGFVQPSSYQNPDIICHKNATPGNTAITVAAGSTIGLQWNTWPTSHKGPVINSLAATSGDWASVDKTKLNWFTAQEGAYIDNSLPNGGKWYTDVLIANNFTGEFTIPSNIPAGEYILRHEIIGLHAAQSINGAQNYPNCINLIITGGGSTDPCASGADCRVGTKFYTETDPGIEFDLYSNPSSYQMPGPLVWSGLSGGSTGGSGSTPPKSTTLATTTKAATTAAPTTTSKAAPTTTTKAATTTTAASGGACAAKYAQCGGSGWAGATCCVSGSTCKASGQYYSQCV